MLTAVIRNLQRLRFVLRELLTLATWRVCTAHEMVALLRQHDGRLVAVRIASIDGPFTSGCAIDFQRRG